MSYYSVMSVYELLLCDISLRVILVIRLGVAELESYMQDIISSLIHFPFKSINLYHL